ncbi:MAG TPA: hypothetical protein DCS93_35585 [Microscillaceae bacterium]|nr:hypothetical protein [Microscillaceae bacterium]
MLASELIEEECNDYDYQIILASQEVNVLHIASKQALVCQINADINLKKFKEALLQLIPIVQKFRIRQLIVDRRNMFTIHFPSLEWFYSIWLPQMIKSGVRKFHIVLPENDLFKFSLRIGKQKIMKENPQLLHENLPPHFYKNLQEVFQNI